MPLPDSLDASIKDLQSSVLDVLRRAEALLRAGETCLGRPDHYRRLADYVASEHRKVSDLELRFCIVAPMKAGKSTIVNAILGAGVLPTRNSAMTSIPTEIVDEPDLSDPELAIPIDTVNVFRSLWSRLHSEVLRRGKNASHAMLADSPELSSLLDALAETSEPPIVERSIGTSDVQRALLLLNDLCRLSPILCAGESPLSNVRTFGLPRLSAHFQRQSFSADAPRIGRLVIVDTPGPNEARQHRVLQQVVAEQLNQTSLVLLVLDYTQLNSQAAEAVSKNVQAVADIVGDDSIFVIVNKVDERDDKGMSAEQVSHFVSGHLSLRRPVASNRLFEVSAKRAFRAADFLRELSEATPARLAGIREWTSTRELAPIVFGATAWQDELEDATPEKLGKRAQRLWTLSNFDSFLQHAIERLLAETAPRALRTALAVLRVHLATVRNDARLRRKAIRADQATVSEELTRLGIEQGALEESRKALGKRLNSVERDLREHLSAFRRRLQPVVESDLYTFFKVSEENNDTFLSGLKRSGHRLWAKIWGDPLKGVSDVVEFDDQAQAREFADLAVAYALRGAKPELERALLTTSRHLEASQREVEHALREETEPILRRAAERLRRQFDVSLEFPSPEISNPLKQISLARQVTKHLPGRTETKTRYEKRWYTLWLWPHEVKYTVKVADRYRVSLRDVAREVEQLIQKSVAAIETCLDDYISVDFHDAIDAYYRQLHEYLDFYRRSLEEAAKTQQLSLDEQREALTKLDLIDDESSRALVDAASLSQTLRASHPVRDDEDGEITDTSGVSAFISYSHADEGFRQDLEKHLAMMRREGLIRLWKDREILPGQHIDNEISQHLESAQIILFLVSADFLSSEYCYSRELARAVERHKEGTAVLVPVIVRACDWNTAPFGKLLALPKDARAVSSWPDRDEAFTDVARGIRRTIQDMLGAQK